VIKRITVDIYPLSEKDVPESIEEEIVAVLEGHRAEIDGYEMIKRLKKEKK